MSRFILKDLNFTRSRRWIIDAHSKRTTDPVYSFIAAWISFNHFYGTFASVNSAAFAQWSKSNMRGSQGDKAQWMFLIARKEFVDFVDTFKSQHKTLFQSEITLPIKNQLTGKDVPDGITGNSKLSNVKTQHVFEVIYQIRNNLFHGDKDPFTSKRDESLSRLGSEFMLLFTGALLSDTLGEVRNAYDKKQSDEIAKVVSISKAGLGTVQRVPQP